ncbi:hypothetical protein [Chryseobacterium sp.]|uniref:hypothetical protein n=1 Tax=Chryseobacterium sp. TaxID=1871047 RepID=UPI0012A8D64D|nr:hypothetical protein [Chryseobacterium sp.]QFG54504.1 hypothetical protein F7R58_12885 [Chryseobacterium sp.]
MKLIGNVKEHSAVVFIRLIEVSFSLLNDHKKGRATTTGIKRKPEMNLPAGLLGGFVSTKRLTDSQINFFRRSTPFNFAYRKTPEIG